jgi:hypothetical protein
MYAHKEALLKELRTDYSMIKRFQVKDQDAIKEQIISIAKMMQASLSQPYTVLYFIYHHSLVGFG